VCLEPAYLMREKVVELSKEYKMVSFEKIDGFDVEVVSIPQGLINAIEKKQKEITSNLDKLEPLYVRKSQAEEGR
jgi:hypothetical protein